MAPSVEMCDVSSALTGAMAKLTDEVSEATVHIVAAASTGIDNNTGSDLHQSRKDQRAFRCCEGGTTYEAEKSTLILPLPGIDMPRSREVIVGTVGRLGSEESTLGCSRLRVRGAAGMMMNVVCPVHCALMLILHVKTCSNGFDDAIAPHVEWRGPLRVVIDVLRV